MSRRFILMSALLIVMALVASACSSSSDDTTTTAGSDGDSTATTAGDTATTTGGTAGEPIELRVSLAFTDTRLDWAIDRADEFNALYPQYKVVLEGLAGYNAVFENALLSIEAGSPPAVFQFFEAATQEARDAVQTDGSPLIKSVTEALAGRTEVNGVPVVLQDVVDAARNYYALDEELESSPFNTSTTIMFVNQTVLDEAGVASIPETWAEVEAACEAIAALPAGPSGCIVWPNHSWLLEQTLAQQGVLFANADNGRSGRASEVFLDSPAAVEYMQWWKDMADKGYYVYTGKVADWGGVSNQFLGGEAAFQITSSSLATGIAADPPPFDVTAGFMPYNQDVPRKGNIIGGATLYLVNGLDKETEDGALMFMNYISNPENAASWHQLTGYIPVTQPAVDLLKDEGWFADNPNYLVASVQLAASENTPATLGPLIGNFLAIRDVFTATAEDIMVNDLDVAEAMAAANVKANSLLADYNLLYGEE